MQRISKRLFSRTSMLKSDKLFVHRDTEINNPNIPFEFTKENMERAKQIIAKYPNQYKKGACMPLLDLGQRQLGYTSISVMNHVAKLLDIPPMRVMLFNAWDPVGKYFVQVCTTTPCELCGSTKVLDAIQDYLGIKVGETTKDGKFTLVEVECAGACVNAPVVAVNDDYYEDLTPESVIDVIKSFETGKPLPAGPRSGRKSCEPKTGLTSLTGEPTGPGFGVRSDL